MLLGADFRIALGAVGLHQSHSNRIVSGNLSGADQVNSNDIAVADEILHTGQVQLAAFLLTVIFGNAAHVCDADEGLSLIHIEMCIRDRS